MQPTNNITKTHLAGIKLYELDKLKERLPQQPIPWSGKALSIIKKRKEKQLKKSSK